MLLQLPKKNLTCILLNTKSLWRIFSSRGKMLPARTQQLIRRRQICDACSDEHHMAFVGSACLLVLACMVRVRQPSQRAQLPAHMRQPLPKCTL